MELQNFGPVAQAATQLGNKSDSGNIVFVFLFGAGAGLLIGCMFIQWQQQQRNMLFGEV